MVVKFIKAKEGVSAHKHDDKKAEYGADLSLVRRTSLKIHVDLAPQQVELSEEVTKSVPLCTATLHRFRPSSCTSR